MAKGSIILGIGAALAALGFLWGRKAEAAPEEIPEEVPEEEPEPELPANTVTVFIKNPPVGATMWAMTLTDQDVTATVKNAPGSLEKGRLAIDERAVFEIPSGWKFPLKIANLTISKWKNDIVGGTIQHIYSIQSYHPYKWDFNKGGYGDEPDPTYRDITIPDYGAFYLEPK